MREAAEQAAKENIVAARKGIVAPDDSVLKEIEGLGVTITRLSDGGFVVAWQSQDQNGGLDGIYLQRFDNDGAAVGTEWNTGAIWLRRVVEVGPEMRGVLESAQLLIHHDEDAVVFCNGEKIATLPGYSTDYETVVLSAPVTLTGALAFGLPARSSTSTCRRATFFTCTQLSDLMPAITAAGHKAAVPRRVCSSPFGSR